MDGAHSKDASSILLEMISGEGLLDARALWAAVVGPHRLALGSINAVTLSTTAGVQVAKNMGSAKSYVFISVSLPFDAGTNPLAVVFGDSQEIGGNNIPALLVDQAGFRNIGFTQVLKPGEELYCRITDPAQPTQRVVVSKVVF